MRVVDGELHAKEGGDRPVELHPLEALYLGCEESMLSLANHRFLITLCDLLGIRTCIHWSSEYQLVPGKTERLVALCRQAGADEYVSGPSAQCYIVPELFAEAGIRL